MLREANIIETLKAQWPQFIGDDAAVLPFCDTQCYVVTKDLLVENIHFRRAYTNAESLAHKAIHVNLSDLAAMGATPCYLLLGIAIPQDAKEMIPSFLKHVKDIAALNNVAVIGGDTTASTQGFFISVTAVGVADPQCIKYRTKACPGDVLCVAGELGYAHLGLQALELGKENFDQFKQALLKPIAKVAQGQWLGQQAAVTAMMDISDGLAVDLKKLCEASLVGADIELDLFSEDAEFISACKQLNLDSQKIQLSGGEDYGLLFSIRKEDYLHLATEFETQFGYPLKKIGHISQIPGVRFFQQHQALCLTLTPFSHFGENL
jgi:thiamine-monophosphate kinase